MSVMVRQTTSHPLIISTSCDTGLYSTPLSPPRGSFGHFSSLSSSFLTHSTDGRMLYNSLLILKR